MTAKGGLWLEFGNECVISEKHKGILVVMNDDTLDEDLGMSIIVSVYVIL